MVSPELSPHDEREFLEQIGIDYQTRSRVLDQDMAVLESKRSQLEEEIRRYMTRRQRVACIFSSSRRRARDNAIAALQEVRAAIWGKEQLKSGIHTFRLPFVPRERRPRNLNRLEDELSYPLKPTTSLELLVWWFSHRGCSEDEIIAVGRLLEARDLKLLFTLYIISDWYQSFRPSKRIDDLIAYLGEDVIEAIAPFYYTAGLSRGLATGLTRLLRTIWEQTNSLEAVNAVANYNVNLMTNPVGSPGLGWVLGARERTRDLIGEFVEGFEESLRRAENDFERCVTIATLALCATESTQHRKKTVDLLRTMSAQMALPERVLRCLNSIRGWVAEGGCPPPPPADPYVRK